MEGRAAVRNFGEPLEAFRATFCKIYGVCKYTDQSPTSSLEQTDLEVFDCEKQVEINKPREIFRCQYITYRIWNQPCK